MLPWSQALSVKYCKNRLLILSRRVCQNNNNVSIFPSKHYGGQGKLGRLLAGVAPMAAPEIQLLATPSPRYRPSVNTTPLCILTTEN